MCGSCENNRFYLSYGYCQGNGRTCNLSRISEGKNVSVISFSINSLCGLLLRPLLSVAWPHVFIYKRWCWYNLTSGLQWVVLTSILVLTKCCCIRTKHINVVKMTKLHLGCCLIFSAVAWYCWLILVDISALVVFIKYCEYIAACHKLSLCAMFACT